MNQSSFEFKFDDTRLHSLYKNKIGPIKKKLCGVLWEGNKNVFDGANLIFIIWGKSGFIKFEFKTISVS